MSEDKTKYLLKDFKNIVYNLLYPAILGGMLYDIWDVTTDAKVVFDEKVFIWSILLFYLADYWHLYNVLDQDKKFDPVKESFHYIFFDLLISILLFVSFKSFNNPSLVGWSLFAISILFLLYTWPRKHRRFIYSVFFLLICILVYKDYPIHFTAVITSFFYILFVIYDEYKSEPNPNAYLDVIVDELKEKIDNS